MMADSGIDLNQFVLELLMYLNEQPEESPNPATQYEEQLKNWMETNGVELP